MAKTDNNISISEESVDFWERIRRIEDKDLVHFNAEITRIAPESDPEGRTPYSIAGELCSMNLAEFNKDSLFQSVGGGIYNIKIRDMRTGRLTTSGRVDFPGAPMLFFPKKYLDSMAKEKQPGPAQPQQNISDPISKALQMIEINQLKNEFSQAINDLSKKIDHIKGNGNGNGHTNNLIETLQALAQFKNLFSGGDLPGIDKVLELMESSRRNGEEIATKLALAQLDQAGDPVSRELAGGLRDLITLAARKKTPVAPVNTQNPTPVTKQTTATAGTGEDFEYIKQSIITSLNSTNDLEAIGAARIIEQTTNKEELCQTLGQIVQYIFSGEQDASVPGQEPEPETGARQAGKSNENGTNIIRQGKHKKNAMDNETARNTG